MRRYNRKTAKQLSFTLYYVPIFVCYVYLYNNKAQDPLPLGNVLGNKITASHDYEHDFEIPTVYMTSFVDHRFLEHNGENYIGKSTKNKSNPCKKFVMYLYTHGLERKTKDPGKTHEVDVKYCTISKRKYKVLENMQGMFSCCVDDYIPFTGSKIGLLVSKEVFKVKPNSTELEQKIRNNLLKRSEFEGYLQVKSSVIWNGQIDPLANTKKHELCAMTVEKNFPELIEPWINYHSRIGFKTFYIYDNDNMKDLTKFLPKRQDTEIIFWPWPRSNILAQSHFLLHARTRCRWISIFDVDEYYFPRNIGLWNESYDDSSLFMKQFLETAENNHYSEITVNEVRMGSSGYIKQPSEPPPEVYVHRYLDYEGNAPKSFAYVGHTVPSSNVHTVELGLDKKKMQISLIFNDTAVLASMGLVHFEKRSWEEHIRKVRGGRGSHVSKLWGGGKRIRLDKPSEKHIRATENAFFDKFRKYWRKVMKAEVMKSG